MAKSAYPDTILFPDIVIRQYNEKQACLWNSASNNTPEFTTSMLVRVVMLFTFRLLICDRLLKNLNKAKRYAFFIDCVMSSLQYKQNKAL